MLKQLVGSHLVVLFITSTLCAENVTMKIENPDGSPAVDAKTLAVMTLLIPAAVDVDLKPLAGRSSQTKQQQIPIVEVKNDQGTITFDKSSKALLIANDDGVAFVPSTAFTNHVKLRKWGRLEIDSSSVSGETREKMQLQVNWMNCLAGSYDRTSPSSQRDTPDWRLHPYIGMIQNVTWDETSVRVPPGEVLVRLVAKSQVEKVKANAIDVNRISPISGLAIQRIGGGATTTWTVPELGVLKGQLVSTSTSLPNWGGEEAASYLVANRRDASSNTASVRQAFWYARARGKDFAELTTDSSTEQRLRSSGIISAINEDGTFTFYGLLPGSYSLTHVARQRERSTTSARLTTKNRPSTLVSKATTEKYKNQAIAELYVVRAGKTTDVGEVIPRSTQAASGTPVNGLPIRIPGPSHVPLGMPSTSTQPTRPLPGPGVSNSQPQPAVSYPYYVPTPPRDFSATDSATAKLIERWLKESGNETDTVGLKKLLEEHLGSEFDSQQKSRKSEIERLEKLLAKSREWLDMRESRRDTIVKKRVDELVEKATKQSTPQRR